MSISSNNDVVTRKKEFRKKIRSAIKELTIEDINAQSQQVWGRLIDLPVYQAAESVGLFLSMPTGEINTDLILKHAVETGKHVYIPEVGTNFESLQMELVKVIMEIPDPTFHKKWPTNRWSIPEPPPEMPKIAAKPGDIDLLVVPGLGFDKNCNRLGQGKGYYDRFIERMITNDTPLPLVAVALEPQCVEEDLPVDTYDKKMDMVVLPSRIILCAQAPEAQLPH
jgi:5-formyltetrahydrofolate cyclo-ligase